MALMTFVVASEKVMNYSNCLLMLWWRGWNFFTYFPPLFFAIFFIFPLHFFFSFLFRFLLVCIYSYDDEGEEVIYMPFFFTIFFVFVFPLYPFFFLFFSFFFSLDFYQLVFFLVAMKRGSSFFIDFFSSLSFFFPFFFLFILLLVSILQLQTLIKIIIWKIKSTCLSLVPLLLVCQGSCNVASLELKGKGCKLILHECTV